MKLKEIIIDWHKEAFGDPFATSTFFHVDGNTLYLITKYPSDVSNLMDKYKPILKENGYDYEIKFVWFAGSGVTEF